MDIYLQLLLWGAVVIAVVALAGIGAYIRWG